jgi:dihydrodipicolinate synthase/N-acetylneuraminate lyase
MNTPVIAIPPSFDSSGKLETNSTSAYLNYLHKNGGKCVMSTAGTSQFNFLNNDEIHLFNECLAGFNGNKILGIPPVFSSQAKEFAINSKKYTDNNSFLMALYPDRHYGDSIIYDYVKCICDTLGNGIYLHTPKMRSGISGDWNYHSDIVNSLHSDGMVLGIKEEHLNLQSSYNFVRSLNKEIDVIVAGGSMRRYCFLESAGANSFLSGIGNFKPEIENLFLEGNNKDRNLILQKEADFFETFMKHGWHKCLRAGLRLSNLTCFYDRQPWPSVDPTLEKTILKLIKEIS